MKQRIHCRVYGRVQGVGFRYFAQELAMTHELVGWVQNTEDGTVELEAEGDDQKIKTFLEALNKGNRFAKVTKVDSHSIKINERERSFSIKY